MPISLDCPKCQKALRVKDELAGRKIACPGCKAVVRVPAAVAAASSAPLSGTDAEALALSAIAEQIAAETPPEPTTIDFTCPQCDAELKLDSELSGRQAPCPECRRIIKVPLMKKVGPRDWRQAEKQVGPTKEILKSTEPVDDSWSSAGTSKVSNQALFEAGVLKLQKKKLTAAEWTRRISWAVAALAFLGLGGWMVSRLLRGNVEAALQAEVEQFISGPRAAALSSEGQFQLNRLVGEYYLEAAKKPNPPEKDGKVYLRTAQQRLSQISAPLERYVLAGNLAESVLRAWPDPATRAAEIGGVLALAPAGSPRWKLFRRYLQQKLAEAGDDAAAQNLAYEEALTVLAKAMPSTPGGGGQARDFSDEIGGLGILGQEFFRAKRRDVAEKSFQMAQMKAKSLARVPLPFQVLQVMLDQPLPEKTSEAEGTLVRAAAAARRGNRAETQTQLAKLKAAGAASIEEAEVRSDLAELLAADAKPLAVEQLAETVKIVQPRKFEESAWARWELCRAALAADGPEAADRIAERLLKDQDLARFRLLLFQRKLEADPKLAGPAAADEVKPAGASSSVALYQAARRQALTDPSAVQAWAKDLPREADVPFAKLAALSGLLQKK